MKKNTLTILKTLICFAMISSIVSCDPDDPVIENPEEIITSVTYTLTSVSGDVVTFNFLDEDGDGGNDPVITTEALAANEIYTGSIELLNTLETPADDITAEVAEEDEDHQLFYVVDGNNVAIDYLDEDADMNPLGLSTTLTTGDAGTTDLTIILRHLPNKGAEGVSDGLIGNAGGDTDVEVTFTLDVQ